MVLIPPRRGRGLEAERFNGQIIGIFWLILGRFRFLGVFVLWVSVPFGQDDKNVSGLLVAG